MAANATLSLSFVATSSSSSSSSSLPKHKPLLGGAAKRFLRCPVTLPSLRLLAGRSSKATAIAAVAYEETSIEEGEQHVEPENDGIVSEELERKKQGRATEIYVCNLPRSFDTEQLLHMFKSHGTVLSAEVCRNAETCESKGCAYVTMGSINSARKAIVALDRLDVGGREMRVRFSAQMNAGRRGFETLNSSSIITFYYEGPHKVYVGNLARSATPEDLRHLFGGFGNVASVRVLQDLKQGKSRVYAFVSYLSERERDAAMSLHGTEFCGRTLVVRKGVVKTET